MQKSFKLTFTSSIFAFKILYHRNCSEKAEKERYRFDIQSQLYLAHLTTPRSQLRFQSVSSPPVPQSVLSRLGLV